jgi:Transglycosylase SLT domain
MAKSHPAFFHHRLFARPIFWTHHSKTSMALLATIVFLSFVYLPLGRLASLLSPLQALELTRFPGYLAQPQQISVDPNASKYRAIGEDLARRFQAPSELTTQVVAKAFDVGQALKLDPLLILAVIAVESRFNPVAESGMGAKGLMQVIPRFHPEKFEPLGGERVAFEPSANITVGATILKEYLRRTGDLGDALQLYVGATTEENENGYSGKVMAERERLQGVLRQFSRGNMQQQAQAKPQFSAI